MARLLEVSLPFPDERRADVIFVHGLDEDACTAWQGLNGGRTFWPAWLAKDDPSLHVLSLAYTVNWAARPLLHDLAVRCFEVVTNGLKKLPPKPVIFVAHNLGGLIVKALVRHGGDLPAGAFFVDTPHNTDQLSQWLAYVDISARNADAIAAIRQAQPEIRALNEWYVSRGTSATTIRAAFRPPPNGDDRSVLRVEPPSSYDSLVRMMSRENTLYREVCAVVHAIAEDQAGQDVASAWQSAPPNYPVEPGAARTLLHGGLHEEWLAVTLWRGLPQRLSNVRTFIDREIPFGHSDWQKWIGDRIRDSHVVLALLSDRSAKSPHMRWELKHAHDLFMHHNRPRLLEIRIGEVELDAELERLLGSGAQHATWHSPDDSRVVMEKLEEFLRNEIDPQGEALKVFLSYKHRESVHALPAPAPFAPSLEIRSVLGIRFVAVPRANSAAPARPFYIATRVVDPEWIRHVVGDLTADEGLTGNEVQQIVRTARALLHEVGASVVIDIPTAAEWHEVIDADRGSALNIRGGAYESRLSLECGDLDEVTASAEHGGTVLSVHRLWRDEPAVAISNMAGKRRIGIRFALRELGDANR